MSKNDDSEKKVINSFTKMLVEISKMKLTTNCKPDDSKKLVDAIYLYHNVQNFQPDILKTDKKFSQLYFTFLEAIINFFPQLILSNQLIRAVTRNFTWYAKSTGTLPQSPGYCYLIFQVLYNFPNLNEDLEISEFFNTVFQIPTFISSFFFSEDISFFVNLIFYQFKDTDSILFFITLLRKQAVFPSTTDSTSYLIIQQFAKEISNNKKIPEERALLSIKFISIYIEKLGKYYPNLIKELFLKNDFNIFYTYLIDHLNDSFIQFIVSLLATPSVTATNSPLNDTNSNKPRENENNNTNSNTTIANPTIFNFMIQQFVKKTIKYEIHLKLIESLYYFIKEYHVDVNSFEPQNFFVILYNIPTHDNPSIKDFLLNFFDMLVTYNYEYSFIIFANYLNEYKKKCPFKRLSSILQRLIITFSFGNLNTNQTNSNYYLQNLPFFFVDSFGDSPQSLGEFLSEYPIFQMLIVVLYQYNFSFKMNDENPRLTWMKKIIECSDYFDHSNILIQMLTVDPSGDLINKYISILKDHFSPSLFNVLTTTLHQSYFLVEQFLQFRGLQTIDKLLPSLDDDLLTNLLVSISSHPFSDELNESILNLPNDHIFFHLKSPKNYYKILKNSPIRLPVFLPFVPAPPMSYSQFDLMNMSKYAVPIYQRFGKKVPCLFKLVNRHLTYRQAKEILHQNKFFVDDASYCSLGDLIDLKADHFPLYEFLPNSQNICVNLACEITEKSKKSLLFWFKIVSPIYQPFSLFHTEKKLIMIENDFLKVDSNHSLKIERNVWHSCVVSNKSAKIDKNSFNFQDTSTIFQCIFGQSNVDCLWIMSPNVRIIENNSIEEVLNKGPQFFDQNEKFPLVAMPNESILVDYSGLPFYFTLPHFFKNEFLNVIENCEDNDQITSLFLLLFNEMIVNNCIEKHWPFVLHLLSTKTEFLNNYLINYLLNFISDHYSLKIFESFIYNTNFWKNLSNRLLGYTLNSLLSHCNNHSSTIFEYFISFLLLGISIKSNVDDSTIQIILFFLSRLSSQFPEEGFMKQLIEIVLFSEKYIFSLSVRLFFIQTALQNDIQLTSKSMPKNWILKLLSYFPSNERNSDVDTFYFAVFNLLSHFTDSDIQSNFPQDSFDATPFIFNAKYWHYFFALLIGQSPHFSESIIDGYSKESKTTIKIPSIIPSIISLTFHGLAVLVQMNFNPYRATVKSDDDPLSFLGEYVRDSFKLLNQICERLPQLFHKDSICLFIQTVCPLIPNLESIFIPKVQLSQSEKFCVNMNIQELILNETLEAWKITNSFQKEIISIRPEISRFSLQSHSIIIPDKKCEIYSKCISNLLKTIKKIESKQNDNVSSFKHILHYTNFTQFSVNLLFANSDKFQELVLYLFGFCPFNPITLFDEYFKLPFQIFISQLNKENLNQNLFEQILKFIIQGFKINQLYNAFSSSINLLFMFLNNALGFINLNQVPNQIENSENSEDNGNEQSNEEDMFNLVKLVREMILLITTTGVQKMPNEILQFLLDSKNIIENEVIFNSHQMICQMISSLHVFYLSNTSSSLLFLKILQSIWPKNDQIFKAFFVSNYSIEVYEAFQSAAVESDISYLSSILKNSSKSFMKLLDVSNSDENNNQKLESSTNFDSYASKVYEIEKKALQARSEFTYLETAIDCSANLKIVLNLHHCMACYEKNFTKNFMLNVYSIMQENLSENQQVFPFAWPFLVSRILTPFYEIELTKIDLFKFELNFYSTNKNKNIEGPINNINCNFENKMNKVLIDYYSGISIDSESNFNFVIFFKYYISKNNGKIYAFNAQFVRNDIEINSSVFILDKKILILLNSSIGDKFDRLIFAKSDSEKNKLLNLFKFVFNFEFGKFSLFHSHPVISLPFDSILVTFEDDQDFNALNFGPKHGSKSDKANLNSVVCLHVYSLKSAAFSLVASRKDLNVLVSSVKPFVRSNFESFSIFSNTFDDSAACSNGIYFNKLDSADLISRFENRQIQPFMFFTLVNAIHGRFFDDWKVPPLFPKIAQTNAKIFHNTNVILKKGAVQCRNAFLCYAPDFLEFARVSSRKNSQTFNSNGDVDGRKSLSSTTSNVNVYNKIDTGRNRSLSSTTSHNNINTNKNKLLSSSSTSNDSHNNKSLSSSTSNDLHNNKSLSSTTSNDISASNKNDTNNNKSLSSTISNDSHNNKSLSSSTSNDLHNNKSLSSSTSNNISASNKNDTNNNKSLSSSTSNNINASNKNDLHNNKSLSSSTSNNINASNKNDLHNNKSLSSTTSNDSSNLSLISTTNNDIISVDDELSNTNQNSIFFINNDNFDMVKFVFDNNTSLTSKSMMSNFLTTEFGEKTKQKSKTTLNIKNTANKIKLTFLKSSRDSSTENDSDDDDQPTNNNGYTHQSTQPFSEADFRRKIQWFLSSNPRLFAFRSCSSFRSSSVERGPPTSSAVEQAPTRTRTSECVCVSKRGTFAVLDCPLRCCTEVFRIFYDEKNRETPVEASHVSTFVYFEFVCKKVCERKMSGYEINKLNESKDTDSNKNEITDTKITKSKQSNETNKEMSDSKITKDTDSTEPDKEMADSRDTESTENDQTNNKITDSKIIKNDDSTETDKEVSDSKNESNGKSSPKEAGNTSPHYYETFSVCYSNPRTIVNEHDLVAVTFWIHSAVIWDIVRGLPLHLIDFTSQDEIIDGIFEENHGLLAFCSTRNFFVYTVNGSFVMRSSLIDESSVIKRILSFDGFKIDYKTAQNEEKSHILYLFVNENK